MSEVTAADRPTFASLLPGDPVPWFAQRSGGNPRYVFDTAAGHYIVLCFFGSAASPLAQEAIAATVANRAFFDDSRACFFGVSIDPRDEADRRVQVPAPVL